MMPSKPNQFPVTMLLLMMGALCTRGQSDNHFRDSPQVQPFTFGSGVKEGHFVGAVCNAIHGSQPLDFLWFKDGEPLDQADVEVVSSSSASFLSIEAVTPEHVGEYTCVVENDWGSSHYTSSLMIDGEFSCSTH